MHQGSDWHGRRRFALLSLFAVVACGVVVLLAVAPRWSVASEATVADPAVAAPAARAKVDDLLDGAVPVPELSTATSRTYRRDDGSYVSRVFAQAPTYRDASGDEHAIDDTLRPVAGGFETTADKWSTFLPSSLSEPVKIRRGASWVSMQLRGAAGTGSVDGVTATYTDALPGADVSYRVSSGAVGEQIHLHGTDAPATLVFELAASDGVTAEKLHNGTIALTADGDKLFGLSPSYAFADSDPEATQEVSTDLLKTADGWRVTLSVDPSWLRGALVDGPVTIDPTVELEGATKDCALTSDTPSLSFCSDDQLWIGWSGDHDHHSLVKWDLSAIPKDAVALWGDVGLNHPSAWGIAVSKQLTLHRVTRDWTNGASWNSYDGTHAWTTPGGDFDSTPAATATVPANHGGWTDWSTTGLVQHWIDGSQPNYGVAIKDKAGPLVAGEEDYFSTEGTIPAQAPELDIVWTTRTGNPDFFTHETQSLDAKTTAGVNAANGNLWLATNDITAAGTGLDLRFDHYYNSLMSGSEVQGLGYRATASLGRDVHLHVFDPDTIGFYRGDGLALPFLGAQTSGTTISYTTPAELGAATLTKNTTTNQYTLRLPTGLPSYPNVDLTLSFDSTGKLLGAKDPAGHTIALSYYAPGSMEFPALGGITDTTSAFYDVDRGYIGGERVTDILDPAGHHTLYEYANTSDNYLTKVTRADGTISRYAYDSSHRIKSITTPDGNVTLVTYNGTSSQIASIIRTNNPAHTTGPTTTFTYSSPTTPCQSTNFDFTKTVVSRPDGSSTTYCANDHAQITYDTDNPTTATPSGEWYDLHDQYTQGTGTHSITLAGADAGSGVKKMALEEVGGAEIASSTLLCDPRNALNPTACPHTATASASFDPSGVAEGARTFRQTTTDYAGNSASSPSWVVRIDRSAPGTPSQLDATVDSSGAAVVGWYPSIDPVLPDGTAGAGTTGYSVRYHVGSGAWTGPTLTTVPSFQVPGAGVGQTATVEITPGDAVGNIGAPYTATVTFVASTDPCAGATPPPECQDPTDGSPIDAESDPAISLDAGASIQSLVPATVFHLRTSFSGCQSSRCWTTLRSKAASWAIGNVRTEYPGADANVAATSTIAKTASSQSGFWSLGSFSGYEFRCAWVLASSGPFDHNTQSSCTDDAEHSPEWQQYQAAPFGGQRGIHTVRGNNCFSYNGTYLKPGKDSCERGTAIYLDGPTVECANVYVLPNGQTRSSCKSEDVIRNLDTSSEWSGYCVNWRYVTKDRQWVMVRDTRDIHYGGWVFIRISALAHDRTTWPSYEERGGTCP
jgi:YD repeat-containing protein